MWRLAVKAISIAVVGPFRGERIRWGAIVVQCLRAGYGSLPLVAASF